MSTTFVVIFVHLSKAKLRQLGIKMYRTWFRTLEQKVIHNFEEFQVCPAKNQPRIEYQTTAKQIIVSTISNDKLEKDFIEFEQRRGGASVNPFDVQRWHRECFSPILKGQVSLCC